MPFKNRNQSDFQRDMSSDQTRVNAIQAPLYQTLHLIIHLSEVDHDVFWELHIFEHPFQLAGEAAATFCYRHIMLS